MDFVFEVLDHVGDLAVIDTGISQLVQKVEIKQAPVQAGLISVFILAVVEVPNRCGDRSLASPD